MTGRWPPLERTGWEATRDHLRLLSQMIGKTALAYAPPVNHWWHVALLGSPHGLAKTIPIPGGQVLGLELDLVAHQIAARASDGHEETLPLGEGSIAGFYARYLELLAAFDLHPQLWSMPVEWPDAIRFDEDRATRPYDREWAEAFFAALREIDRLLKIFRGTFIGKASPVHFFWGSFDLAATRFSGRRAPRHPGGVPNCPDYVPREAYSHECSSAGFWPGGGGFSSPALYSYVYPEPPGFAEAPVLPEEAFYSDALHEFILPYAAVRASDNPDLAVLSFLESTYIAAAETAHWNRSELESARDPRREDERWTPPVSTFNVSSGIPLT